MVCQWSRRQLPFQNGSYRSRTAYAMVCLWSRRQLPFQNGSYRFRMVVTVPERHMPWYVSGRGGTCHRPINDLGPTANLKIDISWASSFHMWIGTLTFGPTSLKSIRQERIEALVFGDTKSSKSYKHLFCTPGWQRSAKQCAISYLFYQFQCGETVFPRGWAYRKGHSNLSSFNDSCY